MPINDSVEHWSMGWGDNPRNQTDEARDREARNKAFSFRDYLLNGQHSPEIWDWLASDMAGANLQRDNQPHAYGSHGFIYSQPWPLGPSEDENGVPKYGNTPYDRMMDLKSAHKKAEDAEKVAAIAKYGRPWHPRRYDSQGGMDQRDMQRVLREHFMTTQMGSQKGVFGPILDMFDNTGE